MALQAPDHIPLLLHNSHLLLHQFHQVLELWLLQQWLLGSHDGDIQLSCETWQTLFTRLGTILQISTCRLCDFLWYFVRVSIDMGEAFVNAHKKAQKSQKMYVTRKHFLWIHKICECKEEWMLQCKVKGGVHKKSQKRMYLGSTFYESTKFVSAKGYDAKLLDLFWCQLSQLTPRKRWTGTTKLD